MKRDFRDVYGEALAKVAAENKKVVVLDADLANSSKSVKVKETAPEQHFDVGIAEANMAAMGAGFARCGFTPFINTFATLAASMCAICAKAVIGYSKLNVRIVGNNNGLGGGYDGASHHSIDDINVMRCIPGMLVVIPSDQLMVEYLVRELADNYEGPAYMSMARQGCDNIYEENQKFEIGKAVRAKQGSDIAIIADGICVSRALEAARKLEEEGIHAAVYDMFTVKPLDAEAVLEAAGCGAILTCEEHSVIGGLGSAVADVIAENKLCVEFRKLGIQDIYTQSGSYTELISLYGIDSDSIAEEARRLFKKKEDSNGN